MEQQAVSFQYAPLSGPRMIRVLVLEPARRRNFAFDFEALSYTWGMLPGTQPILCEGRTVLVTPNCEQAILHIRRRTKARRIWIDAICINHQSIEEKNQQAALMGEIYHGATRSIIWLSPNSDPELLKVLRHAARYGHAINEVNRVYRKARKSKEPDLPRIWTIQEFLLAKSAIFLMGDLECPALALYTYYRLGKDLVKRADLEHYCMRNELAKFSQELTRVSTFQSFINVIIQLAAQNNATDPRDKVFGMEAFLKSKLSEVELPNVDYASSLQQAYEEFTLFLIGTTTSLWSLEFLGTPNLNPTASLPG
ncbi:heterokaryon incompatibility protein-domain-containing protein [Dactylonectria estremocensis]|uniref:Heterokaryon incompatibility protein-domain-containing protein n=1 Tax=Dactylonectria estremocensis TaxID=1079267 RepID=A0A9P9ILI5_9HYPO|nr:heterokaryon incompatibility protein-domain-containing protein [Dactylonectria estremocensis]